MVNQMAGQEVTGVDHLYSPETSDQFIVALREMKTIPNGEERRRMVAGLMSIGLSEHQASELMNGIAEMAIMSGTMRMRPRQID